MKIPYAPLPKPLKRESKMKAILPLVVLVAFALGATYFFASVINEKNAERTSCYEESFLECLKDGKPGYECKALARAGCGMASVHPVE